MKLSEIAALRKGAHPSKFYADEGVEHVWPEVPGWEIVDWNFTNKFGDAEGVAYQHSIGSGVIVDFDGRAVVHKRPGKWSFTHYGKKVSGPFKSEDDVPKVLAKVPDLVVKMRKTQFAKVPRLQGWKTEGDEGELRWTKLYSNDISASMTIYDVDDALDGKKVDVYMDVMDSGGYRNVARYDAIQKASFADLPKFAVRLDKEARKYST